MTKSDGALSAPAGGIGRSIAGTAHGRDLALRRGERRTPSDWMAHLDDAVDAVTGHALRAAEPAIFRHVSAYLDLAEPDLGISGATLLEVASGAPVGPPLFDLADNWRTDTLPDGTGVSWTPDLHGSGYEIERLADGRFALYAPDDTAPPSDHDDAEAAVAAAAQHHADTPFTVRPAGRDAPDGPDDALLEETGLLDLARRQLAGHVTGEELERLALDRARLLAERPDVQERHPEQQARSTRRAVDPAETIGQYRRSAEGELEALQAFDLARRDVLAASRGFIARRCVRALLDEIEEGVDQRELDQTLRRAQVPPAMAERLRRSANAWRRANVQTVAAVDALADTFGRARIKPEAFDGVAALRREILEIAARINPAITVEAVAQLVGDDPDALRRSGVADGQPRDIAGMFTRLYQVAKVSVDITRFDPVDTSFHEAWHSLEPVLSTEEQKILALDYPATERLDHREAVAYAFGRWAAGERRGTNRSHRLFEKVATMAGRLANWMDGHGFAVAEDVFRKAYGGDIGRRFARIARHDRARVRSEAPLWGELSPDQALAAGKGGEPRYKARLAAGALVPEPRRSDTEARLASEALARWNAAGYAVDGRVDARGRRRFEVRSGSAVTASYDTLTDLLAGAPQLASAPRLAGAPTMAGVQSLAAARAEATGVRYSAGSLTADEHLARDRILEGVPELRRFPDAAPGAVSAAARRASRETLASMPPRAVLDLLRREPPRSLPGEPLPDRITSEAAAEDLRSAALGLARGSAPLPRLFIAITARGRTEAGLPGAPAGPSEAGRFVRPGTDAAAAGARVTGAGSMTEAVAAAALEAGIERIPVAIVLSERGFETGTVTETGTIIEPRWGHLDWRPRSVVGLDGTTAVAMPGLPAWPQDMARPNVAPRFAAQMAAPGMAETIGADHGSTAETRPAVARYAALRHAERGHAGRGHADWRLSADALPASDNARLRRNIAAIQTLNRLAEEDRDPTVDERAELSRYAGFGAIPSAFVAGSRIGTDHERHSLDASLGERLGAVRQSTVNAHYTDPAIARSVWEFLRSAGLPGA